MTDAESTPITGTGELITNDGDDGTHATLNNAALVISGDRAAWAGHVGDGQRERARMRQRPIGKLAKPRRGTPQLSHERVQALGVMPVLATPGRTTDRSQSVNRIGRSEGQINAEE